MKGDASVINNNRMGVSLKDNDHNINESQYNIDDTNESFSERKN